MDKLDISVTDHPELKGAVLKLSGAIDVFSYKDLKSALDAWFDEVRKARWSSAADVKRSYATASIVSADRIVFNIKGNDYRLVVATDFDKGIVWIKWIGTHRDYDKVDVREVKHGG